MAILFKRFLVLLLVPAGLLLLAAPFPDFRVAPEEGDFIFLAADLPPRDGEPLSEISRRQLRGYPGVLPALEERARELARFRDLEEGGGSPEEGKPGSSFPEPQGFSPEEAERQRKVFRDIEDTRRRAAEEYRKVERRLLASLRDSWEREPAAISSGEWDRMLGDLGIPGEREASFVFEGLLFLGSVRFDRAEVNRPIPALAAGRRIAGAVLALAGLALMAGLYRTKRGIMIARRWTIVLWDVICICFNGFFLFGALDLFLVRVFGTPAAADEFFQVMGVVWLAVAGPVLPLFISATAAQAVEIDGEGVAMDGLFSRRFLPWRDLRGIEVVEIRSMKRAGGFPAPARLMKILRLKGASSSISLMEPPLKSTKQQILEEMKFNAPAQWRGAIEKEGKAWLAFFR